MMELRKVLLVVALGLGNSLPAQQPVPETKPPAAPSKAAKPDAKKEVDALIRDLGSDSYRDRIEAERQLRELGEAAIPALKVATEQKEDAEVQWRARRVLRQIEQGGQPLAARSRGGRGREPEHAGVESAERAAERTRGDRGVPDDDMRRQFESLFERFEREFGLDVPRARFFDDGFFRDLQEQLQQGAGSSHGMSVQIGPDGAVHVEVQQKNDNGDLETKTYDAPDLETLQREHPGLLQQNGLGLGMSPFGRGGRVFGGEMLPGWPLDLGRAQVQVLPFGRAPQTGSEPVVAAPVPPPVGRRLGVGIRPEVPAELREHLELADGVGLMVESVQPDSLAQALGLRRGDIVTRIGDRSIGSPQDVQDALGGIALGADVEVHFLRKGADQVAKAKKSEANEPSPPAELPRASGLQRRGGRDGGGATVR